METSRIPFPGLMKVALILFLFSSCDKVKDAVKANVDLKMANVEFTIPVMQAGTQTMAEFNVGLNVDSLIKAEAPAFGIKNVKSAKLKSCTITLLNGIEGNNFSAISSCQALLATNNSPLIGIALLDTNPDSYSTTLALPVNTTVELRDYLTALSFSYTLKGITRKAITAPLQCRATITYNVEVGL